MTVLITGGAGFIGQDQLDENRRTPKRRVGT
jgi:nucleoside-diphosphate-sugar epimerase